MDQYLELYASLRNAVMSDHAVPGRGYSVGHFLRNGQFQANLLQDAADVVATPTDPAFAFGDNPLISTGRFLIGLAIEATLGSTSAVDLIDAALRSVSSLFVFSGEFAGLPVRWDPIAGRDWSDRLFGDEVTRGVYAWDFTVGADLVYEYDTSSTDWRSFRWLTGAEQDALSAEQKLTYKADQWYGFAKRFRDHEVSSDEVIGLVGGLTAVVNLLDGNQRGAALDTLGKLANYLADHSYFLVKPTGGFVARGPAGGLVAAEYSLSRVFERFLGGSYPARKSMPEVLTSAGLWEPVAGDWALFEVTTTAGGVVGTGLLAGLSALLPGLGLSAVVLDGLFALVPPWAIGQAWALYTNTRLYDGQDEGGSGEIALSHLLRQLTPHARLHAWMSEWAGTATKGNPIGFTPFIAMTALGDSDIVTRTEYLQMLATRRANGLAIPPWRDGDFPARDAFPAAVAMLLAAESPESSEREQVTVLEADYLAALEAARQNLAGRWQCSLPVTASDLQTNAPPHADRLGAVPNDSGPLGQENADPAGEYLAALAIGWLHATRQATRGVPVIAGFPMVPTAAELSAAPVVTPVPPKSATPPVRLPPATTNDISEQHVVQVGPGDGVVDCGFSVEPYDEIEIAATGQINSGQLFSGPSGPDGWEGLFANTSRYPLLLNRARRYSLVGRLGEFGAYFLVGSAMGRQRYLHEYARRLYLLVNTDTPGAGSGQFTVTIQRWTRGTLNANPDFAVAREVPPPPLIGLYGGSSAAEDWTTWNNAATTTETWLEPTTRPDGSGQMLHVRTGALGCGLVQAWGSQGSGPTKAVASAWVKMISGTVVLGSGNGGDTGGDAVSRATLPAVWQLLQTANGRSPVNEVILYADSDGGAEFVVDQLIVRSMDSPSESPDIA